MISGALIGIPETFNVDILNGAKWNREEDNIPLLSVIQFQEGVIALGAGVTAKAALAIHQFVRRESVLKEKESKYSIEYKDTVGTVWADLYIVPSFIVVDNLENRHFVRDIINKACLPPNTAFEVFLDTPKMAEDHMEQWVRGFSDRRGRVDRGTVFGESVEQDSIFGPELERSTSESVGWVTYFFGSPAKVRVSPKGAVTVWSWPTIDQFLKFIQKEILPYVVII